MRLRKAARVILVGAPGVGKGTQSERLLGRFPQLAHLSSGDLLRHNVKTRTPLGIRVESTMKSGGLVSDDIILRLVRNELITRGWLKRDGPPPIMTLSSCGISSSSSSSGLGTTEADRLEAEAEMAAFMSTDASMSAAHTHMSDDPSASFLLDGFPRTTAQATRLDGIVPINLVVSLKTPFSVMLDRIAGRWVHEPSGRVYNESFNAPKVAGRDDLTGEPLVRRVDDSEAVYRARFNKFVETSAPLLEHYAQQGVLWEVEGLSSDEITPKLFTEFEKRFCTAQR